jgi:hypothetical protein
LKLEAEDMRQSLARQEDTALEKLLIEQCVSNYIQHYAAEARYAMEPRVGGSGAEYFWEARLSASQRRFLRSIETLARIRRAAAPPVQINIAETQTNISASATTPLAGIFETDSSQNELPP